jgi:hypothetical protein
LSTGLQKGCDQIFLLGIYLYVDIKEMAKLNAFPSLVHPIRVHKR